MGTEPSFACAGSFEANTATLRESMRYSELNTYREGRLILSEFFLEHEQALKAVGLAE